MYSVALATRYTKVTNIDQKREKKCKQQHQQQQQHISIKNRVASQDPLKENLFHTFCGMKCTQYMHARTHSRTHTHST